MGKIALVTTLFTSLIIGTALGQPTKPELTEYLKQSYEQQLNITSLPDSFFNCGYRVFNYNYTKNEDQPQKELGDECLYPLLESNLSSIEFSDRGRKLYKALKPQFIQQCADLTISTMEQCTCAHNYYDSQGLGYLDLVGNESQVSEIRQEAQRRCKDPDN